MRPRGLSTFVARPGFRTTIAILLVAVGIAVLALPALAHAELESSMPADGATLAEPLDRFELSFTEAVVPVTGGIRLLADDGSVQVTVFQPDADTVIVEPAATLDEGRYRLVWEVEAADAHRENGTISISVGAVDAETSLSEPTATSTTLPVLSEDLPAAALKSGPVAISVTDSPAAEWLARTGRWALMAGALVAIGALVFAGTALVGSEDEVRQAVRWVRRGGILTLVGTVVEVAGVLSMRAGSLIDGVAQTNLVDLLAGSFGLAVLLRLAGGIALLQDPRLATMRAHGQPAGESSVSESALSGDPRGVAVVATTHTRERFYLNLGEEWVAVAGAVAVAVSFMFDGHTVSVSQAAIARSASFLHVLAAGIWLGGLVVMADTLNGRRRREVPLETAHMAIRFSRAAAAALVVASAAGVALAWTIVESPAELLSSRWGQLLLVKVAFVVVGAALGSYNHFKVVPALDRDSTDTVASDRFRRVVGIEAGVLVAVVAITAFLVNATP